MSEHTVFYYPYGTFGAKQSPLLRAAALYFDKLFILDPVKASWGSIGLGDSETELRLLESEGILHRVSPEDVLHDNDQAIADAIDRDLADPEFRRLCAAKEAGGSRWTLALAKVPQALRDRPEYQPSENSMRSLMTKAGRYTESSVYDEQRGAVEYRYVDVPFTVGEALMLNHALIGSLLNTDAVPITDDQVHSEILNHKLQSARQIPEIRDVLQARENDPQFAGTTAAAQALTDVQLGLIPEALTLEQILEYRLKHGDDLRRTREKLSWMAREIAQAPWTKAFQDEVHHALIPELHKQMESAASSWSSWLKAAGIALGGTAAVLGIAGNPMMTIAVSVAALNVAKEAALPGLQWYQDWKAGKSQNGLHYLLKLRRV